MILEVGEIYGLKVYLEAVPTKEPSACSLRIVKSAGELITVKDSIKHKLTFIELLNVIGKAAQAEIKHFFCPGFPHYQFRQAGTFGSNDKGEFIMGYVIQPN